MLLGGSLSLIVYSLEPSTPSYPYYVFATSMDVAITKTCLDTSILVATNMNWREYQKYSYILM
jgi:hypothetical protein